MATITEPPSLFEEPLPLVSGAVEAPLSRWELSEPDRELVQRVAGHLGLLADLTHADVGLYVRSQNEALLVGAAQPVPVPSLYAAQTPHRAMSRDEVPLVHRVLFDGHRRTQVNSTVLRGAPVVQEVFSIVNEHGEVMAALRSEMLFIEHERQRKRHAVFRRAIARARELIVTGRLRGGEQLGRLGVHDGIMVLNGGGRIEYLSATGEYLYRRLGYADNLVKTQLQELETNEYICFKAMERGVCLEQRVQEGELVWIKRVIPLLPSESDGLAARLAGSWGASGGAIVAIEDVTEELRKEQELKIKTAMIQEIHHRVKNNLQTIAALLRMQARRAEDPAVSSQLRESIGRILSIAVVHEFLSIEETSAINIHEVANRILAEVRGGLLDPSRNISLLLEGARDFTLPAQQATSCALILNELVQNAVEHAFLGRQSGTIRVRLSARDNSITLEIEDNGVGLAGADMDHERARDGLGLQIVRRLVQEDLKGEFELAPSPGGGLKSTVSFPRWIGRT